jgi:hypothetical protein
MIAKRSHSCLWEYCHLFSTTSQVVLAIMSIFLGFLFAIFVLVMFYDQMHAILTEVSTIDQLQIKRGVEIGARKSSRTSWQNVKRIFGGDFDIWWFIPSDVPRCI